MSYKELKKEVLLLLGQRKFSKASEFLVDEILNNNYIKTTKDDKMSEMWIYREGIYVPQGKSEVKEILRNILEEHYSALTVSAVITKIEADTFIEADVFFSNNIIDEIPVQNGILNVRTLELSPFNPEKIFFTKLPVTYNKDAKCPTIDKFLSDILRDSEDKKVFYEISGFGLFKEYFIEKAVMFIGSGRNGKGKALELLKRLYGIENCKNIPLSSMRQDDAVVSELFGKLMNLAGDLSSTSLKETGMFKSLTGRDLISAKRKYLKTISFTNYAKMAFACNELPRVYDYSDGFWERWVLLEFPYKFTTQSEIDRASDEDKKRLKLIDTTIIDKISTDEELSGLLNESLTGLKRLLENQSFSYTKGSNEIKNIWVRKSDSFMAFCMDNLVSDFEGVISKKDMRKFYNIYCKNHKVMGVSDKSIKATLQENYGVVEEYKRLTPDGMQENCWTGVSFINTSQMPIERKKILDFIKKANDNNISVNIYEVTIGTGYSKEICEKELSILVSDGYIFEPKPNVYRLL